MTTSTTNPNDRTFKGFVHDIRTGDVITAINGCPATVTSIEYSKNHAANNILPTARVVGIDRLGITRSAVFYLDTLIDITR